MVQNFALFFRTSRSEKFEEVVHESSSDFGRQGMAFLNYVFYLTEAEDSDL